MKSYANDYGMIMVVDTEADLTTALSVKLLVRKPDGTEVEWSGIVDGTTKIKYTIQVADRDQEGIYEINAYVEFTDAIGTGETFEWENYRKYN